MRYGTVCSGIGAPEIAATRLGWQCSFRSEIEAFPRAVLQHHYPTHPLHGDFTTIKENSYEPIDVLIGGTPCQSFSVAGKRLGLDDARGNLAIEYLNLASRLRTPWLVWENVPGIHSSWSDDEIVEEGGVDPDGRDNWRGFTVRQRNDFATFLNLLGQCGYGYAWRILDGQHFGVPQRRRRIILVGHIGSWQRAAAVLFERESLRGDITPRREAGQTIAACIRSGAANGGKGHGARSGDSKDELIIPVVASTLTAEGFDGSPTADGRGMNIIAARMQAFGEYIDDGTASAIKARDHKDATDLIAFDTTQITSATNRSNPQPGDPCHPLAAGAHPPAIAFNWNAQPDQMNFSTENTPTLTTSQEPAIAFNLRGREGGAMPELDHLASVRAADGGSSRSYISQSWRVRRLTVTECERLMGVPDGYTAIEFRGKPAKDGPRYKALGNSMIVPKMEWVLERIQQVNAI